MRLYDLKEQLGPSEIALSTKTAKGEPQMPKTPQLGKPGAEASAFQTKSSPGTITKVIPNIRDPKDSAQVVFTQIAMANEGNPFFPRFYKAKMVPHGKEGMNTLFVEMEKLQPLFSDKLKHMVPHLLKQLGIPKSLFSKMKGIVSKSLNQDASDSMVRYAVFSHAMNNWPNLKQMAKNTKNPEFSKAIAALKPWQNEFNLDLHKDNWMIRLTGSGPQLVIIDPFFKHQKVGDAFDLYSGNTKAQDDEIQWSHVLKGAKKGRTKRDQEKDQLNKRNNIEQPKPTAAQLKSSEANWANVLRGKRGK